MATAAEIDRVFGVLLRAYGHTVARLEDEVMAETMTLYELCLSDVDAPTLQRAALAHIRSSKWFPTVAELREQADRIDSGYRYQRDAEWLESYYEQLRLRQIEEAKERRQLRN